MYVPLKTYGQPWPQPQLELEAKEDIKFIGPSGVHALPVAAGTNEGGHYFWYCSYSPTFYLILVGQKPKWAVSPRRVCVTVLKFCRGS